MDRINGDLVFGRFAPGPDFVEIERLFTDYVEAANDQVLSIVGELDSAIAALGLRLSAAGVNDFPAIWDVQIGSGIINFRVRPETPSGARPTQAIAGDLGAPVQPQDVRPV